MLQDGNGAAVRLSLKATIKGIPKVVPARLRGLQAKYRPQHLPPSADNQDTGLIPDKTAPGKHHQPY